MTNPDDRREIRNAGAIGLLVALLAFLACCVGCEKTEDSSLRQDVETLWKEHDFDKKTTFERITAIEKRDKITGPWMASVDERLTAIERQLKQPTPVLPTPADEKKLAALEDAIQAIDNRIVDWPKRIAALEKWSHKPPCKTGGKP